MEDDSRDDSNDSDYVVHDVGEGFHGCGGDMTMELQDVMMLVAIVVVLISRMSNI